MFLCKVYKNSDTTLASPVNLNQVVTAKNININKLYGGVNVTQLVKNIIQFAHFREYDQNYADLLEVTSRVQKSLNGMHNVIKCRRRIMFKKDGTVVNYAQTVALADFPKRTVTTYPSGILQQQTPLAASH